MTTEYAPKDRQISVSVGDLMAIKTEMEDMAIIIGCEFGGCRVGAERHENIEAAINEGDLSEIYLKIVKLLDV